MAGKTIWSKEIKTGMAAYQTVSIKLDAALADGAYVLDINGTSGFAHRTNNEVLN